MLQGSGVVPEEVSHPLQVPLQASLYLCSFSISQGMSEKQIEWVFDDHFMDNYTPSIYAKGYIVFVFPFICLSIRMFVRSFVILSLSWNYFKVLS